MRPGEARHPGRARPARHGRAGEAVVGPGEPVELEVTTVDQLGRPVSAELSIAMVDQSLLRLFNDTLPAIGPFFYNQTRTGAFATEATNTFRYAPATVPVSQAVVDEAERSAAVAANELIAGLTARWTGSNTLADCEHRAVALDQNDCRPGLHAVTPERTAGAAAFRRRLAMKSHKARSDRLCARRWTDASAARTETDKLGEARARRLRIARERGRHPDLPIQTSTLPLKNRRDPAVPRERFAETAYWNPLVVTGKDGKARVTFKAPTALSAYRITARGVTGADTLAGQTTSSLTVRKNFFVDLKFPSSLTQGDKPRFIARVHHTDLVGKLALRLEHLRRRT